MTPITRLSDNEGEERKALERYTTRYDRVPERVFVWRGMMYVEEK